MKSLSAFLICWLSQAPFALWAQTIEWNPRHLEPVGVHMAIQKLEGKDVVRVAKDPAIRAADEPTYVKVVGTDFRDGSIEVKVLSRLLKDAPSGARGFIGLAFRIASDNSKFESIYIRPTNGRAEDQVRRNHSTQYFSYPDFKFDRLREEAPEKYESYADMGLNEWITIRIEVKGGQAKLFLNDSRQPCLVVNDLKLGDSTGGVGLYVDNGTEGFFADLKIQND
jgi:hypothetical protein